MAFIKTQKIKRSPDGSIVSGSASICESKYIQNSNNPSYHSKQVTIEKLGKVIWISDNKKSGIFLSPTRGLVMYDAETDEFSDVDRSDERITHANLFPTPAIHTTFGDVYVVLEFIKKIGLASVLKNLFSEKEKAERLFCHLLHSICKSGSRIDCECFIEKSFASLLFTDVVNTSLRSDTRFFDMMGEDGVKVRFFREFVRIMKKKEPEFGKGCFVDSTPLPNDIQENILNAFSSHGLSGGEKQTRMVLVLDEKTRMPVWYKLINGNVVDMNTLREVEEDVEASLGIKIESFVLDAGYLTEELIHRIHIESEQYLIARCPNRRGYHFKTLYDKNKNAIRQSKYDFIRKHHTYFGKREEVDLFSEKEYAYIYVDRENALTGYRKFQMEHSDEFEKMNDREKNWQSVKSGFFILISNREKEPKEILDDYFERTSIEDFFKTSKEYLQLLPLSKWTMQRFEGKILLDMIGTIIWKQLEKQIAESGESVDRMLGTTSSIGGTLGKNRTYTVDTPRKQAKDMSNWMNIKIPNHLKVDSYSKKWID